MGLDMYLSGKKFIWTDWEIPENNPTEDGFKISERVLQLGYWRKHPDLHGYIVQTFADGVDECQDIDLDADAIRDIIGAVKNRRLPKTTGFFFGESDESRDAETLEILYKALEWLETKDEKSSRSIVYQASW
jgi:hypothetical protein